MNTRLVTSIVLLSLALIFILQNTAVVEYRFLFWTIAMSRSLFALLLAVIGILAGWILHGYLSHARK